jgi:hypothetical protein
MGQYAAHDALVHAGLTQPLGGLVGVALGVVMGLVLVEVVEQANQTPRGLVLAEMPGQAAHHSLHADQVTDRGLLLCLVPDEGEGLISLHGLPPD